ncbi:SH2 domain-containing protein 1A-like [Melanotaenia boesemani]|uniref:SH2 domain-containing protein 1A-like n=1 Tax=Melanotaenia boesemani TaxID=1250792 RepID=UPI001C04C515|nr:SH2 domain-containing protein 1A-like [Melanotaenia boesemani]
MDGEGMFIQSIYYGKIGSEATERLMERFGHDGSFLLRDSETVQGTFCLCVRKTPFVHTYRLACSTDGWYLEDSRDRQPRFRTLSSLIEHYRTATGSHVGIAQLIDPLDKAQIHQGLAYMEMNTSSTSEQ